MRQMGQPYARDPEHLQHAARDVVCFALPAREAYGAAVAFPDGDVREVEQVATDLRENIAAVARLSTDANRRAAVVADDWRRLDDDWRRWIIDALDDELRNVLAGVLLATYGEC